MQVDTQPIWYDHYPKQIPHSISYEKKALHLFLKDTMITYPNHRAINFYGNTWTFKQLWQDVVTFSHGLKEMGVQKGDRVAIMLPNLPQTVISYYAVLMTGGIVVQTNPLYMERELKHQLIDSGAKVMICLDDLFPRVMKVKKETSLEKIVVTSIQEALPFPKKVLYPLTQWKEKKIKVDVEVDDQHIFSFQKMLRKKRTDEVNVEINGEEDIALLQYTGGTTGVAKGVMLTHENLVANTTQCLHGMYELDEGKEKTLAVLPFFHVYGMTVSMNLSIMHAAELIILPKFEPEEVMKTIEKQNITIFPGAPTMYVGLLNHKKLKHYDLSSIRACISGSAPLPLEVQQQFEKVTGGKLVEGYGLTEASPVTHCNLIWGKRKEGSIGIPWPDTEAAIYSSEEDRLLEAGEIGELIVRGPQVMKGYWNRPEETAVTLKGDWLFTGDMAYMDEDGYFYIADRKKDMIIAGGFNIYPREIEEVLYEHEAVQEAVVIGVPDPYRGETVKAFIVPTKERKVTEEELNAFCRSRLAAYKVPRLYEFRTELPKTSVGKILKRVLVEEEKKKTSFPYEQTK